MWFEDFRNSFSIFVLMSLLKFMQHFHKTKFLELLLDPAF